MKTIIISLCMVVTVTAIAAWRSIEYYSTSAREEVLDSLRVKENFSGLTFIPETKSYLAIINKGDALFEFDEAFKLKRTISTVGFDDPEDLTYIGMSVEGPVIAIVNETGGIHIGPIGKSGILKATSMKKIILVDKSGRALEFLGNKGLEGITYIPTEKKIIVVKEKNPMNVWSFSMPAEGQTKVQIEDVFGKNTEAQIEEMVTDLSAVSYHTRLNALVLLSDESSKLLYLDYRTKDLTMVIDIENKLQHEALSFSNNYETTFVGSEPYYLLKINKTNTVPSKP